MKIIYHYYIQFLTFSLFQSVEAEKTLESCKKDLASGNTLVHALKVLSQHLKREFSSSEVNIF